MRAAGGWRREDGVVEGETERLGGTGQQQQLIDLPQETLATQQQSPGVATFNIICFVSYLFLRPCAGFEDVRINPLRFLAGCRKGD